MPCWQIAHFPWTLPTELQLKEEISLQRRSKITIPGSIDDTDATRKRRGKKCQCQIERALHKKSGLPRDDQPGWEIKDQEAWEKEPTPSLQRGQEGWIILLLSYRQSKQNIVMPRHTYPKRWRWEVEMQERLVVRQVVRWVILLATRKRGHWDRDWECPSSTRLLLK